MLHTTNNNNSNNTNNILPHGLGLLTTVASLPPKYRSRYLYIKTKCETPLDLTVKPISPLQHEQQQQQQQQQHEQQQQNSDIIETTSTNETTTTTIIDNGHTMTPPLTPPAFTNLEKYNKKRKFAKIYEETNTKVKIARKADNEQESVDDNEEDDNVETEKLVSKTATPLKPVRANEKTTPPPRTHKQTVSVATTKANKATRKLKFDEEHSSPVSGTIIRPLEDITDGTVQYSNGDIDPRYNIVEISEESKAELAAIKNVIGDYICKLCRLKFDDAFGLARHRCACIVLLEYRCPECGKQFNCPANLASHRRWHKPKKDNVSAKKENQNTINTNTTTSSTSSGSESAAHSCDQCGKKFKRQAYLRKHLNTHSKDKPVQKQVSATVVAIAYAGSTSSSGSSVHSFSGQTEVTSRTEVSYDFEHEGLYDCSSRSSLSSTGSYGRLQIVEGGLTEEENIAAAALTNLRNCASVIKHTTLAH